MPNISMLMPKFGTINQNSSNADDRPQRATFTIDNASRRVTKAGQSVHLPPTEYRLLLVLACNAGRVISDQQLLRAVWGPSHAGNGHYLRIYMGHLRHKLEDDPT